VTDTNVNVQIEIDLLCVDMDVKACSKKEKGPAASMVQCRDHMQSTERDRF
jgi:hypothetical protein